MHEKKKKEDKSRKIDVHLKCLRTTVDPVLKKKKEKRGIERSLCGNKNASLRQYPVSISS